MNPRARGSRFAAPLNGGNKQCKPPSDKLITHMVLTTWHRFHPSTEPRAISRQHLREVRAASRKYGTTDVDLLSEVLYLPRWNVRRCLETAGLVEVERKPVHEDRPGAKVAVLALLADGTARTYKELADQTGYTVPMMHEVIKNNRPLFLLASGRSMDLCDRMRGKQAAKWKLAVTSSSAQAGNP